MSRNDNTLAAINYGAVSYHGRDVGTIALTADGLFAFEYNAVWLADGFSISPLSLPLEKRVFVAKPHPLDGVFGVFEDSLPDGWGRLLVDRQLRQLGFDPYAVGPLSRLSIVGSSGMGALEYRPATAFDMAFDQGTYDELATACARILANEALASQDLDALFMLGGSSGGARPKVLVDVDGSDWIVKFPASQDPPDIGLVEYRYTEAARECGVVVPETRLFPSAQCAGYFGIRRFDREVVNGTAEKVHMASAAALLETSHRIPNLDYHTLMALTLRLTDSFADVGRLYRLMCFNVFSGNRDDHAKNFSFVYRENERCWELSPAYDLTPSSGMNGEHATTIDGKGRNIGIDDVVAVGKAAGLSAGKARRIALQIQEACCILVDQVDSLIRNER